MQKKVYLIGKARACYRYAHDRGLKIGDFEIVNVEAWTMRGAVPEKIVLMPGYGAVRGLQSMLAHFRGKVKIEYWMEGKGKKA